MSSPKRLQVKLFFDDSAEIPIKSFIPVFHNWIKNEETGDLLVDVHNYSHMHEGPGILLVGHEGDFAIDLAEGKTGLIYRRKRSRPRNLADLFRLALNRLFQGVRLLIEDESLSEKISFRTDELEIRFPDRLGWPNEQESYDRAEADLASVAGEVFGKENISLERVENDPRDPLSVRVRLSEAVPLDELTAKLKAGEELVEE